MPQEDLQEKAVQTFRWNIVTSAAFKVSYLVSNRVEQKIDKITTEGPSTLGD